MHIRTAYYAYSGSDIACEHTCIYIYMSVDSFTSHIILDTLFIHYLHHAT